MAIISSVTDDNAIKIDILSFVIIFIFQVYIPK